MLGQSNRKFQNYYALWVVGFILVGLSLFSSNYHLSTLVNRPKRPNESKISAQLDKQNEMMTRMMSEMRGLKEEIRVMKSASHGQTEGGRVQQQQQRTKPKLEDPPVLLANSKEEKEQSRNQMLRDTTGSELAEGCKALEFVSSIAQFLSGQYDRVNLHQGKPSYALPNGDDAYFMYFKPDRGDWAIGPNLGDERVYAYIHSDAAKGEDITGTWQVAYQKAFTSEDVKIRCLNENRGWRTVSIANHSPESVETEGYYDAIDAAGLFPTRTKWKLMSKRLRLFYLEGLMSDEESNAIRELSEPEMNKSVEVVGKDGKGEVSTYRTNSGMFLSDDYEKNKYVKSLRDKYAQFVGLPEHNVEALNVLHYKAGQYYKPHTDWFGATTVKLLARGGQRVATCLAWLKTTGGFTGFPQIDLQVPGKQGDAVCWYNIDANGHEDPLSQHQAIPPKEGQEKWVAVGWVRASRFH